MDQPVIVSTARTAIGTAFRGSLHDVDAMELGTRAVAEAVRRSGIDPADVDDVVMGESRYGGGDIARYAAIEAGLVNAPGVALNRHCASALTAIQSGAASIGSNQAFWKATNSISDTPVCAARHPRGTCWTHHSLTSARKLSSSASDVGRAAGELAGGPAIAE